MHDFQYVKRKSLKCVKHYFEANLHSNGISANGKFAVCQCAKSDSDDNRVLAFFDIEKSALIWKMAPVSGWADSYHFDCSKKYLYLGYKDKGKFRYNFDGKLLDKEKWEVERINNTSAFDLSVMAKDKFKEMDTDLSVRPPAKLEELTSWEFF